MGNQWVGCPIYEEDVMVANKVKYAGFVTLLAVACAAPAFSGVKAQAFSLDPDASYDKVYVCKYVGTPGEDERLQTGQNPISVSTNAVAEFAGLGSWFNDQHGRSFVVAWDNGDKIEPPVSYCQGQEVEVPVPVMPAVTDPCGTSNATWVVPEDTDSVVWELDSDGALTAYAELGYVFADGTFTHEYGVAVDSNVACPVTPPEGGRGGGVVQGATTTVAAPAAQLENTGVNASVMTMFSSAVMSAAVAVFAQNTLRGRQLARRIRTYFAQPFTVPTA